MESAYDSMMSDIYAKSCQYIGKAKKSSLDAPILRKYDKYIKEENEIDFGELEELVNEFQ